MASPETKKGYRSDAMVFDVLYVEDYNLKNLPFIDRQEVFGDIVPDELEHLDIVETVQKDEKGT